MSNIQHTCSYYFKEFFIIIWITQHVTLMTIFIRLFTLFNIYLRFQGFTSLVYLVNLKNYCCTAIRAICNIPTMEICLDTFFSRFQITMLYLLSPFTGSVFNFLNSCDSTFILYVLTVKHPLYLKNIEWH